MKSKITYLMSILVILSMTLGACTAAPAPTTEAPAPTMVEPTPVPPTAVPEPTATPAPVKAEPEALDMAYGNLLASMKAYNTIKMDALMEQLAEDQPPFLLDVRTAEEVQENGHIEGAVHIPLLELGQHLDKLPAFDVPIVVYCGSGWRATIAMTALTALGWEDVKALKVTFQEWKDAGNPVVEGAAEEAPALNAADPDESLVMAVDEMLAAIPKGYGSIKADDLNIALAENPDLILIDVRKMEEVEEQGSIDSGDLPQIAIPIEEFVAMRGEWPTDMDASIIVYCGSGHRSTMAMTMLWSYGYTDVRSLSGGFSGWKAAGLPTVGGVAAKDAPLDAGFTSLLSNMQAYNTIQMDALNEKLAEDQPPFLLDVRTTEEVETNGHILGAVHIPLRELGKNLNLLPTFDTPIVVYCGSGWRATIAMTALSAMGWEDVKALKSAFQAWVDAGNAIAPGLPEAAHVLDAAQPDAELATKLDAMLSNTPDGYGVIKVDDFNTLLSENTDLIVIDVRSEKEVNEQGSIDSGEIAQINLPLETFVANKALWPADKNAPIVIYCGSGHRSTMAMSMLWAYGYTDVRSLSGGFKGWVDGGFPVVKSGSYMDLAFSDMLENMESYNTIKMDVLNEQLAEDKPPFLVDVRTTAELEEKGHIEGAVHIPLKELGQHLDLFPDFDTPIVIYCGSGWRATIAMTALSAMGWNDVKALKNTFQEWVDAGYAVAPGLAEEAAALNAAQPDSQVVAGIDAMLSNVPEGYGVIKVDELNTLLVEKPELIVMDVRTMDEVTEKGVIDVGEATYIHIALEEFIASSDLWPVDKAAEIVVYCGSGHRSTMAMTILWAYGYTNVRSMSGGFGAWVEAGFPVAEFATQ